MIFHVYMPIFFVLQAVAAVASGQAAVGWFPGLQDPTGDCTWPPAVVLMAHLSQSRTKALLHNKSVLELGAGNGSLVQTDHIRCPWGLSIACFN